MLLENDIQGLAPCKRERLDGTVLLYYDVGGSVSVASHLRSNRAGGEFFKKLLDGLAGTLEEMGQYLLEPDGLVLSAETVFMDTGEMRLRFLYYPYNAKSFYESCMGLAEELLKELKNEDREAVELGYGFYKACAKGDVTVDTLREITGKASRGIYGRDQDGRRTPQIVPSFAKPEPVEPAGDKKDGHDYSFLYPEAEEKKSRGLLDRIMHVGEKKRAYAVEKKPDKKKKEEYIKARDGGERKEYLKDDDTVFLGNHRAKDAVKAWLVPEDERSTEMIALDREKYVVGKRGSGADITLSSKAVSRVHSKLIWQGDAYALIDLYSKNGTKLNGEKLQEGEKAKLKDGDRLFFADVSLIYRQPEA